MTQITQNNCSVSSLRPLEVVCSPTNASSPESQDGSIQLYINGGTSPYTVSWVNGSQGTYIGNLQAGEYTATVTDYYGDYTETITCTVGNDTFYIDEFIKCSDSFNPNIYVFYDGVSLETTTLTQASESIRSWYQSKKTNGFGGILYEGVIGKYDSNGENWLWWSLYPYLGSLTGGTLSDGTEVKLFGLTGDSVDNSVYKSPYCKSNDNGKCVPKNISFNFSETVAGGNTSDIYKRINNGFTLTGPYGSNDTRTMGVPFTVTSSMNGNADTVYGDFIGGDIEYICIIISNNADASVGLYHGQVDEVNSLPNKNFLFTNPFELYGGGWDDNNLKEPSNRFTHDYESFLKVWEDIKQQGGDFNGFLYPSIKNTESSIPFLQHTVGSVEGDVITSNEFQDKYGISIDSVGPQNLNLSALTHTNVYSTMTTTNTYQDLDPTYQNGAGLKNFDWYINPSVSNFSGGILGQTLDDFFNDIALSTEKIYTLPIDGLTTGTIYKFSGLTGCYSYEQRLLRNSEQYSGLTITNFYDECIKCQPSPPNPQFQPTLCFTSGDIQYEFTPSGTDVNDYFVWENQDNSLELSYNVNLNRWEVKPWSNVGLGNMVRAVNETIPTGNFTNLGNPQQLIWVMSEGYCEGIPLTLTSQAISETCRGDGNGSVILSANGGNLPYQYRVQNVPPYPSYSNSGIFGNLGSGNYLGEVIDSSGGTNTTIFTINQGDTGINYNVSLSFNVVTAPSGSVTWNYTVQVTPSISGPVNISFNLTMAHIRKYRDSGSATFSQTHTITKNGTLNIPYTTSNTTTNSNATVCSRESVNEITEIFTQESDLITMGVGETINGNVTQTVVITQGSTFCQDGCKMMGDYQTTLQISNLSISGTNCSEAINTNIPVGASTIIYNCNAQP